MFLFPPHPAKVMSIQPDSVVRLEKEGGWVAQRKYNGWHGVLHLHHGKLTLWHRSGKPFTKYRLTRSMEQCFQSINPDTEVVLDGELIHGQAVSEITGHQALTDTIVLFDILYCGKPLLTEGFVERYNLLARICGNPQKLEEKKRGLVVATYDESQLWLAEVFKDEFLYHYYEFLQFDQHKRDRFPEIEGLVCKRDTASQLQLGNKAYDVGWMMRVRKTKQKVYLF